MQNISKLTLWFRVVIVLFSVVVSANSMAQNQSDSTFGVLAPIINLVLDDAEVNTVSPIPTGVNATIKSLTRVDGVSPETVYFSAQDSTCSNCGDAFGLNTQLATAYSSLAYHFDFDDSNSGHFSTTNNSRNNQISGSPRAIHTFECSGEIDPNWNSANQRCEFMVGVRVQSQDGRFDDDFIQINIQPLFGIGGYYSNDVITCVSSTSDFSWCPHSVAARQLADIPGKGSWEGQLVLVDNDGGSYSDICMGAEEPNGAAVAMNHLLGNGDRPFVGQASLSTRPGRNCNTNFRSDDDISVLTDHHPQRDAQGNLIDGYGFNQKVVGFQIGRVQNGTSFALIQYHDVDMDFSSTGSNSGQFTMVSSANDCESNDNLSCSNIPYPSYLFLTDSVIASSADRLASVVNIGCFNGCGAVNFGVAGVEVNRAVEHNFRMQGAWGLVLSNNWVRGNHLGGRGPKARVTIRAINTGSFHSISKNPEIIISPENPSVNDYLRGENAQSNWYNRYNVGIDNRINQESHDDGHNSSGWFRISGNYSVEQGTEYIDDDETEFNGQSSVQAGRYRVIRDIDWANEGTLGDGDYVPDCGLITTAYEDGTVYNDSSTIYFETGSCNTVNDFNLGLLPLPVPSAPDF